MQPERQRLLLELLKSYEEFLATRPGTLRMRQQMASAQCQLGEVYLQVGRLEEARSLADQAANQ